MTREGGAVTIAPDDSGVRTGSAPTLMLTIVGLYVRRLGGWIATADLVRLVGELDVPSALARTAIARLKKRGLLTAERRGRVAGYAVPERAARMTGSTARIMLSCPKTLVSKMACASARLASSTPPARM